MLELFRPVFLNSSCPCGYSPSCGCFIMLLQPQRLLLAIWLRRHCRHFPHKKKDDTWTHLCISLLFPSWENLNIYCDLSLHSNEKEKPVLWPNLGSWSVWKDNPNIHPLSLLKDLLVSGDIVVGQKPIVVASCHGCREDYISVEVQGLIVGRVGRQVVWGTAVT